MKLKIILFSFIFACLVFPVFSQDQDASTQRFQALSDTMGSTLTSSNSKLNEFDQQLADSGNTKSYAAYRDRYNSISKALQDSEAKLNRMILANDRTANIKAERDNYENLIKKLDALKSDYDNWLKNRKS